jgi:prolyl 4-hydroxylase
MSEHQAITPELRQWIVQQAEGGQAPDLVLKSMLAAGWERDVAVQALEETLRRQFPERGHGHGHALANGLPPPSIVPEPSLSGAPTRLWAHDREVQVLGSLRHPRVVIFGGLLSETECDELVQLARHRLARSETVAVDEDGNEINPARTSEGMFFERGEYQICARIEARLAALVNWPVEHGEGLQVLRYAPGAEYKPHYDYFDPELPGTPAILMRGGQRVGTVVIYLNTPEAGGATTFPDVKLEVSPVKGNAVFFSYDRPHPMTLTLHGGAPVLAGEKWVATKWLREGVFN